MINRTSVAILLLAAVGILGCSQPLPEPPEITSATVHEPRDRGFSGLRTLSAGGAILDSDVIVRATLTGTSTTTTEGTIERASPETGWVPVAETGWVPVVKFEFRVNEYLKGTGPDAITAVLIDRTDHATQAAAEAAVPQLLAAHDTHWDGREALLFLKNDLWGWLWGDNSTLSILAAADHFSIGAYNTYGGRPADSYSLHSYGKRAWLPAVAGAVSRGGRSSNPDPAFLLQDPRMFSAGGGRGGRSSVGGAETIRLSGIKALVKEIADKTRGRGDEVVRCLRGHYHNRELLEERQARGELPYVTAYGLPSGAPAGTIIYQQRGGPDPDDIQLGNWSYGKPPDNVGRLWLEGPDAGIAEITAIDIRPFTHTVYEDERIRFRKSIRTVRPLPAGILCLLPESPVGVGTGLRQLRRGQKDRRTRAKST